MKEANQNVRCRFAPSPTGDLHVGGARTALFNYLFARATGGKFILRIEDTDLERSTESSIKAIFDGLNWLRLNWDEGPFYQTHRFELYKNFARRLLAEGHAYACGCTAEALEAVREEQRASGRKPQYNRLHRPEGISPQPTILPSGSDQTPFVIRFRAPESGEIVFDDLILGEIRTAAEELDDFIIVRSDGSPTYNFCVVVDDIEMKISHVIRGMDHVSNTPKQIAIYQALGAPTPTFAHVPMILGPDKKKLSKRHGATSVVEYQKQGFLSDGFVNYLARLGWSYGDQEIFSRPELEKVFSLQSIGKSPAVFDQTKLLWVNSEHIKTAPRAELIAGVKFALAEEGVDLSDNIANSSGFAKLIDSLRERSKTLLEMAANCRWLLTGNDITVDSDARKKFLSPEIAPALQHLLNLLGELEDFSESAAEVAFHRTIEQFGIKLGKLAQPARVALTGNTISPPIYTVLEVLGKEVSLKRLANGISLCGGDTTEP